MSEAKKGLSAFLQPDVKKERLAPTPTQAKKEYTAMTVRLTQANYERVGHFLVSNRAEYRSFQDLALAGINMIFEARGMKPLK